MRMNLPFRLMAATLAVASCLFIAPAAQAGSVPKGRVGLQLYSLRNQFATNVPATLAEIKGWGIKNVELAGTYGLTPPEFKTQLDTYGLKAISAHYGYEQYRDHLDSIISDANTLGLKYVGCAWIPHDEPFNEKTCREAIAVFNHAGEVLAQHGLKFFSHTHGYEFAPFEDGTFFDLMMKETNPKYVSFEMDIFWVAHANQDPTALMAKYGNRFQLMHLKGMKESTPTGFFNGHSDVSNDLPVGQGKIAFPPLFAAAHKAGVKWYFIEDESAISEQQIPVSLQYLDTLRW